MTVILNQLVTALRCLPGIGPKSAQRMVFHLLQHQREQGLRLADCLHNAMVNILHCQNCNNFSEAPQCHICLNTTRNVQQLCIVETPAELAAIENSRNYNGRYFVLMGKISPLDGIGPQDIHLDKLAQKVASEAITEVIIALSPTVEGQTTLHFIQTLLEPFNIKLTQLAYGLPSGGEIEYLDGRTIGYALQNRQHLSNVP